MCVCVCFPEQLSEALLEDLLEDTARAAWVAETDRQFEGMAQRRLQAPTLESMLLRMEEIQVRAPPRPLKGRAHGRSAVMGLIFIGHSGDSVGPGSLAGGRLVIICIYLFVSEQRDQEEVRRRFASITYSDPLYWDRPDKGKTSQNKQFKENTLMSPVGGDSAGG